MRLHLLQIKKKNIIRIVRLSEATTRAALRKKIVRIKNWFLFHLLKKQKRNI